MRKRILTLWDNPFQIQVIKFCFSRSHNIDGFDPQKYLDFEGDKNSPVGNKEDDRGNRKLENL